MTDKTKTTTTDMCESKKGCPKGGETVWSLSRPLPKPKTEPMNPAGTRISSIWLRP